MRRAISPPCPLDSTLPNLNHAPADSQPVFPARRFQKQIEEEEKKRVAADRKQLKQTSKKDKVERLEGLLNKSIAYSEFLADRIKKEGEGAIAVNDGSVKGPGLPQPRARLHQPRARLHQL